MPVNTRRKNYSSITSVSKNKITKPKSPTQSNISPKKAKNTLNGPWINEDTPIPIAEDYTEYDTNGHIHWCPSWNDCCESAFNREKFLRDKAEWEMVQAAYALIRLKNSNSTGQTVNRKLVLENTGKNTINLM